MNIVLLGHQGQVGWELQRSLSMLGTLHLLGRDNGGDLSQPAQLAQSVRALRPDVIVNAAAYTAVDRAESEPELAHTVNASAPAALAQVAAESGAWLLHYSTDYVFDGSGTQPWREDDRTGPLSVYGHSKLEGERAIAASGCQHLIFRTSWVYATRGGNFAKTMLRLAQERTELRVIDDQHGAPTGADLLADVSAHALRSVLPPKRVGQPGQTGQTGQVGSQTATANLSGLYHLAASGSTTWHGYASHLIAQARQLCPNAPWQVQNIAPVPSSAFASAAQRPHNSRLNCERLQTALGLRLPPWQDGVQRLLTETLL